MRHLQSTPSTDTQHNDQFIRLFQDMSVYNQPNRRMYIPGDDFTCICFTWLTLKGFEINYPNDRERSPA